MSETAASSTDASDADLSRRVERRWRIEEARFATALARLDPSWGSTSFAVADGVAVLCGPGLFVNRAIGIGIDGRVADEHLQDFEDRAGALGLVPEIEVTEVSEPSLLDRLLERGYVVGDVRSTLVRDLCGPLGAEQAATATIEVQPVDRSLLPLWQETAAAALELTTPDARRASDAFTAAAFEVDQPGLLLARAVDDGRVVGCAMLRVGDGLATLGAMSTLAAERRRGVHSQMIDHRISLARSLGCDLAASTAGAGSDSERNLVRHGFRIVDHKQFLRQDPTS